MIDISSIYIAFHIQICTFLVHKALVRKPEEESLGPIGIHEMIVLKWVLNRNKWNVWNGLIWLRIGTVAGLCEMVIKF